MSRSEPYDVVVLGSGPGGYVAAIRAAQLGMRTAIVERDQLGGICLNWGCIPTKALLKNAQVARTARTEAQEWGMVFDNLRFDFGHVVKRSRDVSARIVKGVEFLMKKNKIDVHRGTGRLAKKDALSVAQDGKEKAEVRFKNLVIATGARPRPFPGVEFDGKRVISYFQAMVPEKLPEKLVIIGGGAIGCEFAYFYNAFGTQVVLIELLPSLLPKEDEEVTKELAKSFKKQKIDVRTGTQVESIKAGKNGVAVKAGGETFEADQVLVSIGITGNIENIGLEEFGIRTEKGFIVTDERERTSVPNVRAIGDVNGKVALAHVASHQGIVAVEDIAGKARHLVDYTSIPSCTYCQPQVASIGLTEKAAREKGDVKVGRYPFRPHGKAVATNETEGFVKLIFGAKYGELVGAHIIGSEATEMIAEAGAAKSAEATVHSLAETIHAHPTMSEAFHEAALDALGRAIHL